MFMLVRGAEGSDHQPRERGGPIARAPRLVNGLARKDRSAPGDRFPFLGALLIGTGKSSMRRDRRAVRRFRCHLHMFLGPASPIFALRLRHFASPPAEPPAGGESVVHRLANSLWKSAPIRHSRLIYRPPPLALCQA